MILNQMKHSFHNCYISILLLLSCTCRLQGDSSNSTILLYSTSHSIKVATYNAKSERLNSTTIVENFTKGPSVDYNYEKQTICWSNSDAQTIVCDGFNGMATENKAEIISSQIDSPNGLACDWFTNKIYWTDSETKRIEVVSIQSKFRRTLFWTDIDLPRAIALAPMKGLMFWTDWGEISKIEKASMNGDPKTRTIIVKENIDWPNGLTIDFEEELIYWVDGKSLFIEAIDFNGTNRSYITKSNLQYPFSLDFFRKQLFWTDWKIWSLNFLNITSKEFKKLNPNEDFSPMYVRVYDKERQPMKRHPCEINNGGCSELCLLSSVAPGYSCACRSGVKMKDNFNCANGPQQLLLLARRNDIILIHLDTPDYSYVTLPLSNIKYTIAVDYDPINKEIYWSDEEVNQIQKAYLNGSNQQIIAENEIQQIDGIALDWLARNIYWTDTGTDKIEVCTIDGKYRKVIIFGNLMEPRAIAVAPNLGWLFWSDWYEKNPKIERSNLDGSAREAIIVENLGWPNGITLDLVKKRLYWCDAKIDKIEYSDMDGKNRMVLINDNVPHVFGFSLMGDFLYWTDWQKRTINRAHKDTGAHRELILDQVANVMGLKAIDMSQSFTTNECSLNNGNCEQFCFYRHNKTKVCSCILGYELKKDGFSCEKPKTFLLYAKANEIGMIGIQNTNNHVSIPIAGISSCTSINYDINTMRVYWSDKGTRTIMRAFLNGSDPQKVIDLGLSVPSGIAIDWVGLNIYWVDSEAQRIEVARLPGSSRKALLWEGSINNPSSIVLDPPNGRMYWFEGGSTNKIKCGPMDGSHMQDLTTTEGFATQLTLDYKRNRLYWIENFSKIWSIALNSYDVRLVIDNSTTFRPVALALYQDYIYWSNDLTGEIVRSRLDGSDQQIIHKDFYGITDIQVYHSEQHDSNQCATSNGGCSNLCLTLPPVASHKGDFVNYDSKFTCACPTHYSLIDNECKPPTEFMIYSQKNLTIRILPNSAEYLEVVLPIQGLKAVKAIDFDLVNNTLYWIEGKSHSIKKDDSKGKAVVVVHGSKELQPYDLVIDSLGRLLFWTCSVQNIINVTRLNNDIPFGVIIRKESEKPRLLAIHSRKRILFYTDIDGTGHLMRTRLDGSYRFAIAHGTDINAIAVDEEKDCIVWLQGQTVYMSNLEGGDKTVLVNDTKAIQLTILSGWVYWIDREFQLQKAELSGKQNPPLQLQASHIVDLISVTAPDSKHPCRQSSEKGCSHLCIMENTKPICACPDGNVLKNDNKTCSEVPHCGKNRFTCSSVQGQNCIPITWRCDGELDCLEGSDELNCSECEKDQFRCGDGKCISNEQVCNRQFDCSDQSDENGCCNGESFQCKVTKVCITLDLVCNQREDCADSSDENPQLCGNRIAEKEKPPTTNVIWIIVGVMVFLSAVIGVYWYIRRSKSSEEYSDQSQNFLNPTQPKPQIKFRKGIPDVVRMSMVTGSETSYDRNHITGASSSTIESSLTSYPREPLNPPPSPATTRGSSPSSRYRPYRHYRSINQPPPPTPCSTDVCDESDCNYPTRSRYDGGPFPPPPTPRSHCHSESCPPSPSSRSSTYFNPLPPPPSPVASAPRGYDS